MGNQTSAGLFSDSGLRTSLGPGFELSTAAMVVIDEAAQIHCANTAADVLFADDDMTGRSILDFCLSGQQSELETAATLAGDRDQPERAVMIRLDSGRRLRVLMRVDAVTSPSDGRLYLVQFREVMTAAVDGTVPAESKSQLWQWGIELPGFRMVR